MENNPRFQLTSKQLIFVIIGTTIAMQLVSLARITSVEAKQDAWLAVILGSAAPLISLLLIERLGRRFPSLTLAEISRELFGRFFGSFFTLGFILYCLLAYSVSLRNFSEISSLYILPKTPFWVITLFGIIAAVYIASMGAKTLARINELLFYILLIVILLIIPTLKVADYTNLLPVGGGGISGLIKGALQTTFAYAGLEILLVAYPMVTRKDEVLKAGITANVISLLIYLIIVVVSLMVFGSEFLSKITWPGITLLKVIDVPVFERLEFFFLIPWVALGVRPTMNILFAASFSLIQLLNIDINRYYPYAVVGLGLVLYIASLLPKNALEVARWANLAGYSFLIIAIGYPLIFHTATFIRKKR